MLGERFVDVADIFRIFVLIRFIDLLWGPNHEMLVSNGFTVRDAHANLVALTVWVLAFALVRQFSVDPLIAAVSATAVSALAGQATRYGMLRQTGLIPVMGHGMGPALPVVMTLGVLAVIQFMI